MIRLISILLFCNCFTCSCRQVNKNNIAPITIDSVSVATLTPSAKPIPIDSTQELLLPWADSLILKYIEATKKSISGIAFIYDGPEKRDSATYLVYKLGENFEDHYATNHWLYIDSITRVIYNYNLTNDSLIKWQQ